MRYLLLLLISTLMITGCKEHKKKYVPDEVITNSDYSNTFVYDSNSPYHDLLKHCISIQRAKDSCALQTLPLLMQESKVPTKAQIKQRLVVSHHWMGERFLALLDRLPEDLKKLFGATTAIVIDDDIIPAYYWVVTGAIYLDPRYLWLTPQEAQTITPKDDYRSGFGKALQFYHFRRYVKENHYAYHYTPLDRNITRSLEDIEYAFAHLLYHELSHANDFTRPEVIENADKSRSIFDVIQHASQHYISTKLYQVAPLESKVLQGIGAVLYHGRDATEVEKTYSAKEIGTFFDADGADDLYAYSTPYEDLAMLFEMTMMRYHFGIQADEAFLPKPTKTHGLTCSDYKIAWGKRDRLADEQVKQRALFVVKALLPHETNWETFFATTLSDSLTLEKGKSWCEVVDQNRSQRAFTPHRIDTMIKEATYPPYL